MGGIIGGNRSGTNFVGTSIKNPREKDSLGDLILHIEMVGIKLNKNIVVSTKFRKANKIIDETRSVVNMSKGKGKEFRW